MATTRTLPDDTPAGTWQQLKDDLGYLKLNRALEVLPGLLDTAREQGWSHTAARHADVRRSRRDP